MGRHDSVCLIQFLHENCDVNAKKYIKQFIRCKLVGIFVYLLYNKSAFVKESKHLLYNGSLNSPVWC